ncbi:MAG: TrkH family potassium uptake protein [Gammaproteobacteria bacterium]|nr:TrkH family potassium uptake protein [Gammaproteobacteria bacterium]
MQVKVAQRVLGILLSLFSMTMLPPIVVGMIYKDGAIVPFVAALVATLVTGLLLFWPVRNDRSSPRLRDGFVIVVMFWCVLGIFGGLPFYFYKPLGLTVIASIFESMSGLTTTGATLIVGLDELPHSILFYRQQTQWLGGMGIIVLAIAVLPMLQIGGLNLYKAETPGLSKDKLTPRIASTAKALWYIYMGLTISCALAYMAAGMNTFDAIAHSFSTVAIGGFSTHDASIGYFNSSAVEMVAVVFMLISGVNFGLHFMVFRNVNFKRSLSLKSFSFRHYQKDEELRAYAILLCLLTLLTCGYLYFTSTSTFKDSLIDGLFHVVSIGTTTGFTSAEYFNWPGFLPVLLLFASFVGGCSGSTGGGMKVIRVLLLFKQGQRELRRLLHPNAMYLVKVGERPISKRLIDLVWGFFATYLLLLAIMLLLLMAAGLNQETAFSAVVACLNNLGPGLGDVAANYSTLSDFSLVVLSFAMLFGRLEIFTLLILFTPAFWRK